MDHNLVLSNKILSRILTSIKCPIVTVKIWNDMESPFRRNFAFLLDISSFFKEKFHSYRSKEMFQIVVVFLFQSLLLLFPVALQPSVDFGLLNHYPPSPPFISNCSSVPNIDSSQVTFEFLQSFRRWLLPLLVFIIFFIELLPSFIQ